jgi:hypothetical protein
MKLSIIVALLATALATPAYADVSIKQITNGRGLGFGGKMEGTTYIKGNRMRSDVVDGKTVNTIIFDLDAQRMYVFDSRRKEADVWDMAAFASELSKSVDASKMKTSLTPNGQTKTIAGQTATGYTLDLSMPAALGGSNDLSMMVTMTGPVWIVKGAPGTADYLNFYKAAAEKGWIFTNPSAAKGAPGQARAMTEMYRQLAATGGIAYEIDTQTRMGPASGGNPIGGLLGRIGNVSMTTTVQSVETGPLSDDMFAPPAGYKLNQKK